MSNTHDNGGPAFPRTGNYSLDQSTEYDSTSQDGMTLRDYFAAKAMHAEISTAGAFDGPAGALVEAANACGMDIEERIAYNSYQMADAMLAARAKAKPADPVRDAAPELLEALRFYASEAFDGYGNPLGEKARAAIAKATGSAA